MDLTSNITHQEKINKIQMFSTTPFDSCSSLYENPSSNNSFLENFPTSLLDDEELLFDHLLHHQSPYNSMSNNNNQNPNINCPQKEEEELCHVTTTAATTTTAKAAAPREGGVKRKRVGGGVKKQSVGPTARRRTGKKDRHSKIYTAQGPRDRRMRLSLQIARKFFDLQDMLGFDKASKTIEWLFSNSKSAIRDLTSTLPPHMLKGSLVISNNNNKVNLEDLGGVNEPKLMRSNAKPGFSNPVARESREKARARARQRTLEKKRQKELMLVETNPNYNNSGTTTPTTNNNVSKFGSSSTLETVDQENQMSNSVSIIEKLLGSDSSASSSSIYDDCSYLGSTGNWVMDSLRIYPSNYGAFTGVDELQVILQQQNPKSVSSAALSDMHFQYSYPENQVSSSSRG